MQMKNKVLIVDDNPANVAIIEEILGEDYSVKTAEAGEQGLEIAQDFQPDIILLDIMMPGIDGYEVCKRLRANPTLKHTKIIMVSAKVMTAERLEAYEAGADDYLTKPFEEDELLAKVRVYSRLKSMEEIDQLKTSLLALLGHETRTPLGAIISPAEMLMSAEKVDPDQRKRLAEMIHRNAKRLHRLYEKAMILSAMKSGKLKLNLAEVNLCEVVREAIRQMTPTASEQNVRIQIDCADCPTICVDREKMTYVLTALLDNAILFSPAGESITVSISTDNGSICLKVTNHGEGIDPDFLQHVFDEFTDPDFMHHTQGQGLSLAIARQTVLQHNGTISVENTKGSGTTFTIELPSALVSQTHPEAACLSGENQ